MLCAAPVIAQTGEEGPASVRVGAGTGAIRLDGLFDEPGWAAAESMSALTMLEPSEGVAPTFATTVRGPRQPFGHLHRCGL